MEIEGVSLSICPQDVLSKKSNEAISVLVVDNDVRCLEITAAILKEFKYEVVTVRLASDALSMLRMKEVAFDLVITDPDLPEMNGFELLKAIAEEFKNLPVVLMSSDPGEVVALKVLEYGASHFILKPMRADDVKDLWQFAAIKNKTPRVTIHDGETVPVPVSVSSSSSPINDDRDLKKKAPMIEDPAEEKGKESQVGTSKKKAKVVWTNSLNNCFLEAIWTIGLHRSVPRKILEAMNNRELTRENVASKLQKYRVFLNELSYACYKVQKSANHHKRSRKNSLILRLKKFPFKQPIEQYFPAAVGLFGKSQMDTNTYGNSSTATTSEPFQGNNAVVHPSDAGGSTNIAEACVNPFPVGNDVNHHDRGQFSDVVRDYRVMQPPPNLSPPFTNEGNVGELHPDPDYNPMFDLQHLVAFANSQPLSDQCAFLNTNADQSMILNQPQDGDETFGTSSFYGDMRFWDHIGLPSFAPNQNLINMSQEVGTSSSAQLSGRIPSTSASEQREKEEFFNSLFASCGDGDEDITLDGI